MKVLAFAEQREGKFKKSAFEATQTARRIADALGAELVVLAVGDAVAGIVPELGSYGAGRVLVCEDPRLRFYSTTAYEGGRRAAREDASVLFLPQARWGRTSPQGRREARRRSPVASPRSWGVT
jgi:electron transfer flavoprotein alpha subunit